MTPEQELREALERQYSEAGIVFEPSSNEYFDLLQKRFPVCGSKIDWDRVSTARVKPVDTSSEQYFDDAMKFAEEIFESELRDPQSLVVVIGDSAMEGALRMPLSTLRSSLRSILRMPQHTYVLAPDAAWCLVFTMEGDLCFGYAP
jgi:hypothetical protein